MEKPLKRSTSHPASLQRQLELVHLLVGDWIETRVDWMINNKIENQEAEGLLLEATKLYVSGKYKESLKPLNLAEFILMN